MRAKEDVDDTVVNKMQNYVNLLLVVYPACINMQFSKLFYEYGKLKTKLL